ncbi:MAG TPA: EAL domain-containing response regulator [Usitatibacter sp.]|jgi:EAL domain-containing protein (putative c-di-GMP-specific phosphodiesterase class I)/CheY-like chemotaxis protein|nr:EAL domain-containing response regulator [Usitatibacter sp.]
MEIDKLRFLVVEDHQFQRWLADSILREAGATAIYSAADGRAALDILSVLDPPVDVVVSDLDMPGMDGMELVRHIAAQPRPASLIIVTSMDPKVAFAVETMARALNVPFLGTIQKPFTARKLVALLAAHIPAKVAGADLSFSAEEIARGLKAGQFEALLQPKVDMRTEKLVGLEALGRWRHPEHGFVNPRHFIEVAEAAGLMDPLTTAMARGAAQAWHTMQRAGFELTVSVNLSVASLTDVSFAERITQVVREENLDPADMVLEVTESLATSDLAATLENLSRLRIKGFGLSLDDYGTGYSSMQRLTRVPFTEIKVDGAFVKAAPSDPHAHAMVESSLELGRKLKLDVVAEGVETRIEWDLLITMGCPVAQGYYIGRPMEVLELLEWARARRKLSADMPSRANR